MAHHYSVHFSRSSITKRTRHRPGQRSESTFTVFASVSLIRRAQSQGCPENPESKQTRRVPSIYGRNHARKISACLETYPLGANNVHALHRPTCRSFQMARTQRLHACRSRAAAPQRALLNQQCTGEVLKHDQECNESYIYGSSYSFPPTLGRRCP